MSGFQEPENKAVNHIKLPANRSIPEIQVGLYEPIGVRCGPVAPGIKGVVIGWPPPHGWDGENFNRIQMIMNDINFEVFCQTVMAAWKDWKG